VAVVRFFLVGVELGALVIAGEAAVGADIAVVEKGVRAGGAAEGDFFGDEIIDDLGHQPEWMCLPVGNGGNITAYWRGYDESLQRGDISRLPRMLGAQAEGSAAMVRGEDVLQPETIATAIRIGAPVRREEAGAAARDSNGGFAAANDREILDWFGHVVRDEGVFCEPSSAASLAGLANARRDGLVAEGAEVVCVLTGNGLKDPDTAIAQSGQVIEIPAEFAAAEQALYG
jgi:threonine synthase